MRNLIFVCFLFVGCSQLMPTPAPKIDEYDAKAKASVSILLTELKDSQPDVQPDNTPKPGDKCPTCNGKGKTGDGTHFSTCMDCNGTGKVPMKEAEVTVFPKTEEVLDNILKEEVPFKQAEPEKSAVIVKKKLVVYSAQWCGPCQEWKTKYSEEFKRLGVELDYKDIDNEIKPIIVPGGKQVVNIPFFVYYENDIPIKWFQGRDISPDYMRANGIQL